LIYILERNKSQTGYRT